MMTSLRLFASDSTIPLAAPKPDFSVNSRTIYEGDTVRFTNRTPSAMRPGPVGYTWSVSPQTGLAFAVGTDSSSKNPIIRFTRAGRYSMSLQSAIDSLRADTTKTDYITVLPVPAPKPDFRADTTPFYAPGTVSFTNQTPAPIRPGTVQYQWSIQPDTGWAFEQGQDASAVHPTVHFLSGGTYSVSLRSILGSETADTTKPGYIRVLSVPIPDPDFIPRQSSLYMGDETQLLNYSQPPAQNAAVSFAWTIEPGTGWSFTSGDFTTHDPELRFDSAGRYTVSLRYWVNNLHRDTTKRDVITVLPIPTPEPDFRPSVQTVYQGEMSSFENLTLPPIRNVPIRFSWRVRPGTGWTYVSSDSSSYSPSIQFDSLGFYGASLRCTVGQVMRDTTKADLIHVIPVPAPQPDFITSRQQLNVGDSVSFLNLTRPPVVPRPVTYSWELIPATGWQFAAGSNSGWKTPFVRFTQAGRYSVRLTTTVGSQYADTLKVDYFTVGQVTALTTWLAPSLALHPNPAHDAVLVQATAQIERLTLIDALGRTVFTTNPEGRETLAPVENLPAGLYQVQAETKAGILRARLVRE